MMYGDDFFNAATALALLILLVVAVATDLKQHRIPNLLLLPALSLALMLHMINGGVDGLATAAGGLTLGLAMLLPLYAIGAMGAGDIKLLGVVGSFVGPWGAVVAGLATMMAGAAIGIAIISWHRLRPLIEFHVAQLLSPREIGAHSKVHARSLGRQNAVTSIPYAPAIAAGTAAALWYIDFLPKQFAGWGG